jgi:hypothetical protein
LTAQFGLGTAHFLGGSFQFFNILSELFYEGLIFFQGDQKLLFYEATMPLLEKKRGHFGENEEHFFILEGLVWGDFYEEGAHEGFIHEEGEGVESRLGGYGDVG